MGIVRHASRRPPVRKVVEQTHLLKNQRKRQNQVTFKAVPVIPARHLVREVRAQLRRSGGSSGRKGWSIVSSAPLDLVPCHARKPRPTSRAPRRQACSRAPCPVDPDVPPAPPHPLKRVLPAYSLNSILACRLIPRPERGIDPRQRRRGGQRSGKRNNLVIGRDLPDAPTRSDQYNSRYLSNEVARGDGTADK